MEGLLSTVPTPSSFYQSRTFLVGFCLEIVNFPDRIYGKKVDYSNVENVQDVARINVLAHIVCAHNVHLA